METIVELSARLKAVAGLVTSGNIVCDAGCDHGYVSIYLVQAGISPKVIAMDIRKGPLSRAQEHIRQYGLGDYIETRLSDGVEALQPKEADTLILAGMGGRLMQEILTRGWEKVCLMKELILQPQSELAMFRRFLKENGFGIAQEDMVYEDGKFYPMMRVVPGQQVHTEVDRTLGETYGSLLLANHHPVLAQYLEFEKEKLQSILLGLLAIGTSEKSLKRCEEIRGELDRNEQARQQYFE